MVPTPEHGSSDLRPDATEAQVALATGIAHYSKLLIRIGTQACIQSCVAGKEQIQLTDFLQPLENKDQPTCLSEALDARLDVPNAREFEGGAGCRSCEKSVQDRCLSSQWFGGSPSWHLSCFPCQNRTCGKPGAYDQDLIGTRPRGTELGSIECKFCGAYVARAPYFFLSKNDQNCFLLYRELWQLKTSFGI